MVSKVPFVLVLLLGLKGDLRGAEEYVDDIRPVLERYCLKCHSTAEQRAELDLERFAGVEDIRRDLSVWQMVADKLENGEMPPEKNPQPSIAERTGLVEWVRALIVSESQANTGDPGRVLLRRLSNAQYDYTIRDLTGVDLQPAVDFPVDSAAGEGFTNTGDALVMSPALLEKYFNAAKTISRHAVLLPDGIRFSRYTTRRDWTEEIVQKIRTFYGHYTETKRRKWMYGDVPLASDYGQAPMESYIRATVEYREDSSRSGVQLSELADKNGLSRKYLTILWNVLSGKLGQHSFLLDDLRTQWRSLAPENSPELAAEIRR